MKLESYLLNSLLTLIILTLKTIKKPKKPSSSWLWRQQRRHFVKKYVTKELETILEFEPVKLIESKPAETQNFHACNVCEKIFEANHLLVDHVHKVVCDRCEMKFQNQETLEKNVLIYHIANIFIFFTVKNHSQTKSSSNLCFESSKSVP